VLARDLDVSSETSRELLAAMFQAKIVPLRLLGLVKKYGEFHHTNFPAVRATIKPGVKVEEFDVYFDFVLGLVEQLKPLWNV